MKTTVIRQRVADFLNRHAPFDSLTAPDLLDLAGSGKVKFHESEEYVFRQGDGKGDFVWVIQQGRVELLKEAKSSEVMCDVFGEGDVLGLERFAGDGSFRCSARTATDVILYGVNADLFDALITRYPVIQRFLAARFSVSSVLGFNRTSWLEAEAPSMDFVRAQLTTLPASIAVTDAMARVIKAKSGIAALVAEDGRHVGIVSAHELCTAQSSAARAVCRPCPPTVAEPYSTRRLVREMIQSRREEVLITADGTEDSRLEGIVTSSDLAMFCGCDPARLIAAIRNADSIAEIRPLLKQATRLMNSGLAQPSDIDDCCIIGHEVIAAAADACIRLAHIAVTDAGMDAAEVPYCWVVFGASARGELLEPGLPRLAAVYDDSDEALSETDILYFTALAGETEARFRELGFATSESYWPDGAQPSMPLSEWKRLYSETIRDPISHDLFARREFLDLRSLSGDALILQKLQKHILHELQEQEMAIPLLANDTLMQLPPLTFFHGLVLNLDGGLRDSFNIADAVVSPLADAARVFSLANGRLTAAGTLERFESALFDFPEADAILREAADAFRIGLYYRTVCGSDSIDARKLGKFDQLLLKSAFASIQRFLEFTVSTFVQPA